MLGPRIIACSACGYFAEEGKFQRVSHPLNGASLLCCPRCQSVQGVEMRVMCQADNCMADSVAALWFNGVELRLCPSHHNHKRWAADHAIERTEKG